MPASAEKHKRRVHAVTASVSPHLQAAKAQFCNLERRQVCAFTLISVQAAQVEELGAAEAEEESTGTGAQAETQRRSVLSRIWRQLKVCAATGRPTTEVWSLLPCHQFQMLPEDNKRLAASTDTDFSKGWLQDY